MKEKTLKTLEYYKIVELLLEKAESKSRQRQDKRDKTFNRTRGDRGTSKTNGRGLFPIN